MKTSFHSSLIERKSIYFKKKSCIKYTRLKYSIISTVNHLLKMTNNHIITAYHIQNLGVNGRCTVAGLHGNVSTFQSPEGR